MSLMYISYCVSERKRERYCKELAHAMAGAVKSKIFREGWKLETQGRDDDIG